MPFAQGIRAFNSASSPLGEKFIKIDSS